MDLPILGGLLIADEVVDIFLPVPLNTTEHMRPAPGVPFGDLTHATRLHFDERSGDCRRRGERGRVRDPNHAALGTDWLLGQ